MKKIISDQKGSERIKVELSDGNLCIPGILASELVKLPLAAELQVYDIVSLETWSVQEIQSKNACALCYCCFKHHWNILLMILLLYRDRSGHLQGESSPWRSHAPYRGVIIHPPHERPRQDREPSQGLPCRLRE